MSEAELQQGPLREQGPLRAHGATLAPAVGAAGAHLLQLGRERARRLGVLRGEALGVLANPVRGDRLPDLLLRLQQPEELERVLLLLPLQRRLQQARVRARLRERGRARAQRLDLRGRAGEARL